MSASNPRLSIVMAAYNRSNIIGYALDSVLRQTYADWELLVVGDACTDDTARVVAGVRDPRVRFVNLPSACGDQSGPNNSGVTATTGELVAFLNQDDLWAPRHLQRAVDALDAHPDWDLVYGLNLSVEPDGRLLAKGPSASGRYEAHAGIPASAWVFRRRLAERVGPWRSARELHDQPSQEWLRRASRGAATLQLLPYVSVLSIPSGNRTASYSSRQADEHTAWAAAMASDPDWEEHVLAQALRDATLTSSRSPAGLAVAPHLRRALINTGRRLAMAAGLPVAPLAFAIRYGRRGGLINSLRRQRGLPVLSRKT